MLASWLSPLDIFVLGSIMGKGLFIEFIIFLLPFHTFCQRINSVAPDFVLKTQYGQSYSYKSSDGRSTIIIIGDRKSGKDASEWLKKIKESAKDTIQYIQIAATGWVPFFVKTQVLEGFSEKPPILVDWNNSISNKFGYSPKKAMIIYMNTGGRIKAFEKGNVDSTKLNNFINKLNE